MGIDPRSPRFGALVTLVVLAVVLVSGTGYLAGATWLGLAATAAALVAAFLNGVFGFCLGCQLYPFIRRVWAGRQGLVPAGADQEI